MKYKVQTSDAVKFELEDRVNEVLTEIKKKQKEIETKDDILTSVQKEMQQQDQLIENLKVVKEELQIEKAELVHLLQIKSSFIQQIQDRFLDKKED